MAGKESAREAEMWKDFQDVAVCKEKCGLSPKECMAEYGSAKKSLRAYNLLEGMAGSQGMWVVDGKRVEKVIILNLS